MATTTTELTAAEKRSAAKLAKAAEYRSRFASEQQAAFSRLLTDRTNAAMVKVAGIGNLASSQYLDKDGSFTREDRNATAMRALDAIALEIDKARDKFNGTKADGPKFTV